MKTSERDMARKLRLEGLSMREIERRLGVARSTVSAWVREIELTDHQREEIHARGLSARSRARRIYYRARRRRSQDEGRAQARRQEALHVAGCMLFWAEGSRQRNVVQFTNSDPSMMAFFVRFLRNYFELPNEALRVACNLFADHEEIPREIEDFWLSTLGLPRSCLTKTMVNKYSPYSKRTRKNKLPYGTCKMTVCRTDLVQHIYGAIQEYADFDRPEWLD
jgi:transcriptional regulator with XRE-family HTH domain